MRCRFVNKIFQSEENGFTVAVYSTHDESVPLSARNKYLESRNIIGFSAVGYNLPLTNTIELEMEGDWENGSHGLQLKVDSFMEIVPRTKAGIIGYLSSGAIKGVKQRTAESIYQQFGLQTLDVIEKSPEKLLSIRGISERKLREIVESYGQNQVFRELMTFLAPYKVTPKKVNMILKTFHEESVRIIQSRPYMLCAVKGFGFLTVDAIGRQLCRALNDPMRISGCISYILHEAMKEGHLYLNQETLMDKTLALLNQDLTVPAVTEQDVSRVLYQLVMQQSIVVDNGKVYIFQQYEEELLTAVMIAKKLQMPRQPFPIEVELDQAQQVLGITLSERQKQTVRMVFESPLSIITGGPGTGKTTVLKVILYIHGLKCKTTVQLMAPTGRAARRMAESTGNDEASTMHMALGLLGESDYNLGFQYLEAEFLNVDEVSMVDMHLAYEFFSRVKDSARVLLLGDVDQLPSVGAGDCIQEVRAFVQDFAAMMTIGQEITVVPKAVGIDIGGFTTDYLLMRKGRPDMDYCDSLEKGVITMYNQIISSINSEYDMLLEDTDIDSILDGNTQYYDDSVVRMTENMVQDFVTDLLNSIRERGIDTKSSYTVFIGGGAVLLKRFLEKSDRLGKYLFIEDLKANARGYDLLYRAYENGK